MKPFFVLLFALMATTSLHANPYLERSLQELEVNSNALWADAVIHISSMTEKYRALPKGADGLTNSNALFQLARTNLNKSWAMITSADDLKDASHTFMKAVREEEVWLLGSTDGNIPPINRLNAAMRDINCAKFSLELTVGADSVLQEATALAYTVLTSCKAMNHIQLGRTVSAATPSEANPPSPKMRKKK